MVELIELDSAFEKKMAPHREHIWLVYSQNEYGHISLRAICTKEWIVKEYVKAIRHHTGVVRVWTEKTITNHLYGELAFERKYPSPKLLEQLGFPHFRDER